MYVSGSAGNVGPFRRYLGFDEPPSLEMSGARVLPRSHLLPQQNWGLLGGRTTRICSYISQCRQ